MRGHRTRSISALVAAESSECVSVTSCSLAVDGVATRFTTNTGMDTIDTDATNDALLTDSTTMFGAPSWR